MRKLETLQIGSIIVSFRSNIIHKDINVNLLMGIWDLKMDIYSTNFYVYTRKKFIYLLCTWECKRSFINQYTNRLVIKTKYSMYFMLLRRLNILTNFELYILLAFGYANLMFVFTTHSHPPFLRLMFIASS